MNAKHIVMIALCGLTATATLVSCEDKEAAAAKAAAAAQMQPLKVSVMKMQQQDVVLTSTWFGHLRGVEQADIRPEVSGKLIRQVYEDGTLVKQGDVLFEIDPSSYKAAVDQCAAALAAAEASVLQATAADDRAGQDVARYGKLVSSGSVSEKNFTDAQQAKKETEAALAMANAQVKQAKAALENAKINLDRCTIRAPFTGLASKATVSVGDLISVSSVTPLTSMSSIDPIRVDFAVPGKHMLSKVLQPDYDASKQQSPISEFSLILEDGSTFENKGTVTAVDSEVSQNTGTVNFIGQVPNPKLKLRSGSAVRVVAETGVLKQALLVPSRAIVSSMNHRYIFVVNPTDKTPICIDVKLGQEVPLPMPNGDGNTVPMLMQVVTGTVKPIAEQLEAYGITSPTEAEVIVEGGIKAGLYAKINGGILQKAAQAPEPARAEAMAEARKHLLTVVPEPFIYTAPVSTTPSVTAKQH